MAKVVSVEMFVPIAQMKFEEGWGGDWGPAWYTDFNKIILVIAVKRGFLYKWEKKSKGEPKEYYFKFGNGEGNSQNLSFLLGIHL